MNALKKLANGMNGRDAIAKAWATCPSRVSVKHPDGASVKTGVKAGASAKDIADSIVIAAATIKRGDGLSLSRKLASSKADVTGSQNAELDKLDEQAHAAIVSDFADAFGGSEEAQEEAAGKIMARVRAFAKAIGDAKPTELSDGIAANRKAIADKRLLAIVDNIPEETATELANRIESCDWTNEQQGNEVLAAINSAASVTV